MKENTNEEYGEFQKNKGCTCPYPLCPCHKVIPPEEKLTSESWEKELYQLIPKKHYIISRERHYEPIKDFIKQILSAHNARLIERVEGMKETEYGQAGLARNQAIDDILKVLKEE